MKECVNMILFLSNKLLFYESSLTVREFASNLSETLCSKHKEDIRELSDIAKITRIITEKLNYRIPN